MFAMLIRKSNLPVIPFPFPIHQPKLNQMRDCATDGAKTTACFFIHISSLLMSVARWFGFVIVLFFQNLVFPAMKPVKAH